MTEYCNRTDIPRIVRGNDFTLRVEVRHPVLTSEGNTDLESFDISECTNIKVALVTRLGRRKDMPFSIGNNADGTKKIMLVPFDETIPSGLYGLEIVGKDKGGNDWRYYGAPGEVLQIVEPTSAAHIPSDDTVQGYYDIKVDVGVVQFSQKLLSDMSEVLEQSREAVEDSKQSTEECVTVTKAAKEATDKANKAADTANKILKETLMISLSCNHDENIIGKKVYVKNSEDGSVLEQHDWQGDTIKTSIAPDQKYYIECEEIEGYSLPKSDKFTAVSGNVREVSLAWESEWFYPTLQMEDGTDCDGTNCVMVYNITGKRVSTVYKKGMCIKVPMGQRYQLVPVTKAGYYSGIFVSRTAKDAEYRKTAVYKASRTEIGIQMVDGTVIAADDWDDTKYSKENVNGILVCATGVQCVMSPQEPVSLPCGGYGAETPEGADAVDSYNLAKGQLGESNTEALVKAWGEKTSYGAGYCHSVILKSGKRCYLPALDELINIYVNRNAINACAQKLLGKNIVDGGWKWSSTLCASDTHNAWSFSPIARTDYRHYSNYCLPVSAL